MEPITINLPPELADCVRDAVDKGEFASPGEAVNAAVAEWRDRRERGATGTPYDLVELRAMMAEGLASGPSRFESMAEVKAEARARLTSGARKA